MIIKQAWVSWVLAAGAIAAGCSASSTDPGFTNGGGTGGNAGSGGDPGGSGGSGGMFLDAGGNPGDGGGGEFISDPTTCEQAVASRSYIGCDYWPTVTANNVWSIFDFAVVVSNVGKDVADVTITGPSNTNIQAQVQPGTLNTFYLPWVPSLKGPDADTCGSAQPLSNTILAKQGAYHLTSTRPIMVYQFSALEYKGSGGPAGKNWGACPGNKICASYGVSVGCFSFSNDASLLLPSTAMTGSYRLAGASAWDSSGTPFMPTYAAVTATQDGTKVESRAKGKVRAGGGLPALQAGGTASVTLQQGDVLEVMGGAGKNDDLSGSLIFGDKPIQVITGMACRNVPTDQSACDHIEESVFPAETLGREYFVTRPASPKNAAPPGQWVRVVGNQDGTTITFDPPITAPGVSNGKATLQAGSVLDLGIQTVDFKVSSPDKEFLVVTFLQGADVVDPAPDPYTPYQSKGDPSQSLPTATEQFRTLYIFLAPADYDLNFVNVVAPPGAQVTLDGQSVNMGQFSGIGNTGFGIGRLFLSAAGAHKLESNLPVGIQVYGYGAYTTYQYPGGLNLKTIAPPPLK